MMVSGYIGVHRGILGYTGVCRGRENREDMGYAEVLQVLKHLQDVDLGFPQKLALCL